MITYILRKPKFTVSNPPVGVDVLWRCREQRYSVVIDADADIFGVSDPELYAEHYVVLKRTPSGAWIRTDGYDSEGVPVYEKRFVNLKAHKRFACNTVEEAVQSYVRRRGRQLEILARQTRRAEEDKALGEAVLAEHFKKEDAA